MRRRSSSILVFLFASTSAFCCAQNLPISRSFSSLNPSFIDKATQVVAAPVAGASGSVQVIFRTSEQGDVIETHVSGGSSEMKQSADAALKQWKFKVSMINGQAVQMLSAVVITFMDGRSSAVVAKPMSSQQLSPRLGFPCPNALLHQSSDASDLCKKQLEATVGDAQSTPMEAFTAHYEFGVALLSAQQPKLAVEQFNQAIKLAPTVLKDSDAEWAYAYWLRGIAEAKLGSSEEAQQDLTVAQKSMSLAEMAVAGPAGAYYHRLGEQIAVEQSQAQIRSIP